MMDAARMILGSSPSGKTMRLGARWARLINPRISPYSAATESGTSCFASVASARVAAIFISSLISVARTSSAPRKMNGKPRTLLTWFG
jgi:hypothetical protein